MVKKTFTPKMHYLKSMEVSDVVLYNKYVESVGDYISSINPSSMRIRLIENLSSGYEELVYGGNLYESRKRFSALRKNLSSAPQSVKDNLDFIIVQVDNCLEWRKAIINIHSLVSSLSELSD